MGTPGVKWNVKKDEIVEALKRRHGRLTYACKDLGCCYETLQKAINKDKSLIELVDKLRNEFDTTLLDSAESYLMRALSQGEDLSNGLKATFYVLNNKGRPRGYTPPRSHESDTKETEAHEIVRAIREINQAARDEGSGQPKMAPVQSLLDQRPGWEEDQVSTELGSTGTAQ